MLSSRDAGSVSTGAGAKSGRAHRGRTGGGAAASFCPRARVTYTAPSELELDRAPDYDLAAEDLVWLGRFNAACPALALRPSELRLVLDRLEKDSRLFLNSRRPRLRPAPAGKPRAAGKRGAAGSVWSGLVAAPGRAVGTELDPAANPLVSDPGQGTLTYASGEAELMAAVSLPGVAAATDVPQASVAAVASHWLRRRRERRWRPLHRRHYTPTARDMLVTSGAAAQRVAGDIRFQVEKLRMLTHLVRRREVLKRDRVAGAHALFLRTVAERDKSTAGPALVSPVASSAGYFSPDGSPARRGEDDKYSSEDEGAGSSIGPATP